MASKESKIVKEMSPREGKILRYLLSTSQSPVAPERVVVTGPPWTDLPFTMMEANISFGKLVKLKLANRTDGEYEATKLAEEVMSYANKLGMWKTPPSPAVTNNQRRKQQ